MDFLMIQRDTLQHPPCLYHMLSFLNIMAKTTEASGGFVLCVCFVCCCCLFLSDKFFTVQFKWVELYLSVTYSQKYSNWCMSTKRNLHKSTLTGCLAYCGYTRTNSGKIPDCLMLRLFSKFFFSIISNTDEYYHFH